MAPLGVMQMRASAELSPKVTGGLFLTFFNSEPLPVGEVSRLVRDGEGNEVGY